MRHSNLFGFVPDALKARRLLRETLTSQELQTVSELEDAEIDDEEEQRV